MTTFSPTIWMLNDEDGLLPVLTLDGSFPGKGMHAYTIWGDIYNTPVHQSIFTEGTDIRETRYSISDFLSEEDLQELADEDGYGQPELAAAVREMMEHEACATL